MRIAIGSLQCEGNSLTPIYTKFEDFDYAPGEAMYDEIKVVDYLARLRTRPDNLCTRSAGRCGSQGGFLASGG